MMPVSTSIAACFVRKVGTSTASSLADHFLLLRIGAQKMDVFDLAFLIDDDAARELRYTVAA